MLAHVNPSTICKTQWKAFFKHGFCSPTIVYGESESEAMRNALAHYRKNKTLVDFWGIEDVVDHVDFIGR